jgi:hypothetical protein
MTQTNGNVKSEGRSDIQSRVDGFDSNLDSFLEKLGVNSNFTEDDVGVESRRWLNLSPSQLRKCSLNEVGEGAYVLSQLAFRLQIAMNRENARMKWAEESIKKIISPVIGQYVGTTYDERRVAAIRDNDAANKLDKVRVDSMAKGERLLFLSSKVESMSRSLMSLKNTRKIDESN